MVLRRVTFGRIRRMVRGRSTHWADKILGMPGEDHGGNYWVQLLRKNADEMRARGIKRFGEDGYEQRQRSKQLVIDALISRVDPLVDEARASGFVFFRSDLRLMPTYAVRLCFADAEGRFYVRSLGLERIVKQHLSSPQLSEFGDIENAIHVHVRRLDGIAMLERDMRRKRVRAPNK